MKKRIISVMLAVSMLFSSVITDTSVIRAENVEMVQVEETQTEETQTEETQTEETQFEETQIEETQIEETQTEEPQTEEMQIETVPLEVVKLSDESDIEVRTEDGQGKETYLFPGVGGIASANMTGPRVFMQMVANIESYLEENEDGTFTRTEMVYQDFDQVLVVEDYSADFELLNSRIIDVRQPLKETDTEGFLGQLAISAYYSGETANWVVLAGSDENIIDTDEFRGMEILRVLKYSKDWNELQGYKSIYNVGNINTWNAYYAGMCAMSECNGVLAIHTNHLMCLDDTMGHQANFTLLIREEDFGMDDQQPLECLNSGIGISPLYVSHSLQQYMTTDGTNFYYGDLGDGFPRAVRLTAQFNVDPDTKFYNDISLCDVLEIKGEDGENETGVEMTDLNYLNGLLFTTGRSVDQEDPDSDIYSLNRNLYLAYAQMNGEKLPNSDSCMKFQWLTDDAQRSYYTPSYMVNVSDNEAYIMYQKFTDDEDLDRRYTSIVVLQKVTVGADRTVTIGEPKEIVARLSEQKPICTKDGRIVWYFCDDNIPMFVSIDPEKAGQEGYYQGINLANTSIELVEKDVVYNQTGNGWAFEGKYKDYVLTQSDYLANSCDSLNDNRDSVDENVGKRLVHCSGSGVFVGHLDFEYYIYPPAPQVYVNNISTTRANITGDEEYGLDGIQFKMDVFEEGKLIYSDDSKSKATLSCLKPDTVYYCVVTNYVMVGGEPFYGIPATYLFKTLSTETATSASSDCPVIGMVYDDDGNMRSSSYEASGMKFFTSSNLQKDTHYYLYSEKLTQKDISILGYIGVQETGEGIEAHVFYNDEELIEGRDYRLFISRFYDRDFLVTAYGMGDYYGELTMCFELSEESGYDETEEEEYDKWNQVLYTEPYDKRMGVGHYLTKEDAAAAANMVVEQEYHYVLENGDSFLYQFTPTESTIYMLQYKSATGGPINISVYVEDTGEFWQNYHDGFSPYATRTLIPPSDTTNYNATFFPMKAGKTYYLQGYNTRSAAADMTFSMTTTTLENFQETPYYTEDMGDRDDFKDVRTRQSFWYGLEQQGFWEGNRFTFDTEKMFWSYYEYKVDMYYTINGETYKKTGSVRGGIFDTNADELQAAEEWTAGKDITVNARFGGQDFVWNFHIYDSTDADNIQNFEIGKDYVIPGQESSILLKLEPEKIQSYKITVTDPAGNDVNDIGTYEYEVYDRFGNHLNEAIGGANLNESCDFRVEELTDERAKDGKAFYYLHIYYIQDPDRNQKYDKEDDWIARIEEQTDLNTEFRSPESLTLCYGGDNSDAGEWRNGRYYFKNEYIRSLLTVTATYSDDSSEKVETTSSLYNSSLEKWKRYAVISTNQDEVEWTANSNPKDRLVYVDYMGERKTYQLPYVIESYIEWIAGAYPRDIGDYGSSMDSYKSQTIFEYTPSSDGEYWYFAWRTGSSNDTVFVRIIKRDNIKGIRARTFTDTLPYGNTSYGEWCDGKYYYDLSTVSDRISVELNYTIGESGSENSVQLVGNQFSIAIPDNGTLKPGDTMDVQVTFTEPDTGKPMTTTTKFTVGEATGSDPDAGEPEKPKEEYITVHYYSELGGFCGEYEGEICVDAQVKKGEKIGSFPAMALEGFDFNGWYNSLIDQMATADTIVNEEIWLYASWNCRITFEPRGGTMEEDRDRTYPIWSSYGELPTPVREGYRFRGWFTTASYSPDEQQITSESVVNPYGEHTLYARWVKNISAVEAPVASIPSGNEVEPKTRIYLITETSNAQIYYTLDKTIPSADSFLYDDGIVLTPEMMAEDHTITICAVATRPDKTEVQDSEVVSFVYTMNYDPDIPEGLWVKGISDMSYTGKAVTLPELQVYYGNKLLQAKVDYSVTYKNNINAGTAKVTIKGKGNYKGSRVEYFNILPLDIRDALISKQEIWLTYNKKVQKPTNTILYELNGKMVTLKAKRDFEYIYPNTNSKDKENYDPQAFVAPGTYTVIVRGKGNYAKMSDGSPLETRFTVHISNNKTMSALKYTISNAVYNEGERVAPNKVEVKNGKKLLARYAVTDETAAQAALQDSQIVDNYDYVYYTANDTAVGKASITFLGTGKSEAGYVGTVTKSYSITGTSISKVKLEGVASSYKYTGDAIMPAGAEDDEQTPEGFRVYFAATRTTPEITLTKGKDYTVSYAKNVSAGTATLLIKGINGYTGTAKKTFKIVNTKTSISKVKLEGVASSYEYTGSAIMPAGAEDDEQTPEGFRVYFAATRTTPEKNLKKGEDYTVSYAKNVSAGTATLLISGINGYTGTVKKTFKIKAYEVTGDRIRVESIGGISYEEKGALPAITYEKGGVKPAVVVYDTNKAEPLVLGKDYTVTYSNNTSVNDGSSSKVPTVTISGKGNYAGKDKKAKKVFFQIVKKDISETTITATDIVYQEKSGNCKPTISLVDTNGSKLKSGTDYSKQIVYTYAFDTQVYVDGISEERMAGDLVQSYDIIPSGAEIMATVTALDKNYSGETSVMFRCVNWNISGATVKISDQYYTGNDICPGKDQIKITVKGRKEPLGNDEYEIVSVYNNRSTGTATVVLRGTGSCGGLKKATFAIKQRTIS